MGWRASGVAGSVALTLSLLGGFGSASAQDLHATGDSPDPVVPPDPQQWVDQAEMTWDDYVSIRPEEWYSSETSQGSEEQWNSAFILLDYEDQPFLITEEPESHPFGNPQSGWEPVDSHEVNEWYEEYYTVPNEYNGGQTLHGYWMENTHGRLGIDVDVFGPYTLPGKVHEYGLAGWGRPVGDEEDSLCPAGDECDKDLRGDGGDLWRTDIGCDTRLCGYDSIFFVTAGHDESSTWQELGEMMFRTADDVPAAFGPPGAEDGPVLNEAGNPITNYAGTRYVPWTSWRAAANHWPSASRGLTTQAESSGQSVFAHEFSHVRGLPDNYNNPFVAATGRNYTGYWEMMSRGTFNGPGGTHNRWQVPNVGGSGLGPHHMVYFKTSGDGRLDVLAEDEHIQLNRQELADEGVAVVPLKARSAQPDGDLVGLTIELGEGGFTPGACEDRVDDDFWCTPSATNWQNFTMEVVDRVGNDSFTPGHGVLLAQTRPSGYPRVWMVDANPEDIDRVDFYRPGNDEEPGGEPVPVSKGDPRQLDDATFHAGTGSDSEFEYVDEYNDVHFYVLDAYRDDEGTLFYDVAVRNLDGAGEYERGAELGDPVVHPAGASTALVTADLTNTGDAGDGVYGSDVYRLSASVDADGWDVSLPYEVTSAASGESVPIVAHATAGDGAGDVATVTITATSESDPEASATVEFDVTADDVTTTFESAAALVDAYAEQGLLERSERQRLLAQLRVAERSPQRPAERALDRFVEIAEDVAEVGAANLASAALVSVAEELRTHL
ncbi:peptidase M6 [Actinobacteria bacterium YIM 96077]|uniref:Peptidase M6 n=1 Tax=Phytoactinopolyspora halophila TaxID=1981511 RepID=A0A329QGS6_9ACTN|nr:immune inhibitor A domain-containing protein [Phytoactinopolyspora halophila]AYY14712.1 peptidase M6 [Actinobacteria bacterium YIM 96077]RAW11577.1 peptidase M6 [Phytoactinopolyspora halophila]